MLTPVTMEIAEILTPEQTLCDIRASSKKQILQKLGDLLSNAHDLNSSDVLEALCDREKLGSTGVGCGVAIPHARINGLDHMCGLFAKLHDPVDFDSVDGRPVDLVFMLLGPEDTSAEHLQILSKISRLLRNGDSCKKLRSCTSANQLFNLISGPKSAAA